MISVSVVIPVYNSAPCLDELRNRLVAVLTGCAMVSEFEMIMVDDGSRDSSWEAVSKLARSDQRVRGIRLSRNFGQHNALLRGIRAARFETIVTIDDDLQHPPEAIPILLFKLEEGFDVVYGSPQSQQHGFWRDIASSITKLSMRTAMGIEAAQQLSAFRAFRTRIRDAFVDYQSSFVSIDVLLTWGTNRFTAVPVRHDPRLVGQSNYTFAKLLSHSVNMLTGYSILPLQIASITGFVFTFFGLCILAYVVGRYIFQGSSVPGFPFLASIIAIFSGTQLFTLGIIGEYLARMHFRLIGRPSSVVSEQVGPATEPLSESHEKP